MGLIAAAWPSSKTVIVDGQPLLAFSGCDYLGLSHHPRVLRALRDGINRYGLGANGSRITTGTTAAHVELEARLAGFCGAEAAVVLSSGSLANAAACEMLYRDRDIALIDSDAHSSLRRAATGNGASERCYAHGDASAAAAMASEQPSKRVVVMSDGVFAASGDVAPVSALLHSLPADTRLLLDDSHALGVLGARGAGSLDAAGCSDPRVLVTASLGKALGCSGGMVLGRRDDIAPIQLHSASYRGGTPLPAAVAQAALAAIDVLTAGGVLEQLRSNLERVRALFQHLELPVPPQGSAIFSFAADAATSAAVSQAARQAGVLLPLMDYPGGPAQQYFRVAVSAAHDHDDIQRLADVLGLGVASG